MTIDFKLNEISVFDKLKKDGFTKTLDDDLVYVNGKKMIIFDSNKQRIFERILNDGSVVETYVNGNEMIIFDSNKQQIFKRISKYD